LRFGGGFASLHVDSGCPRIPDIWRFAPLHLHLLLLSLLLLLMPTPRRISAAEALAADVIGN
jgi:hypothetical protein